MTTKISSFTVQVQFRDSIIDVELTPKHDDTPIPVTREQIELWEKAEKVATLFSDKIKAMLEDAVPSGDTRKLKSADANGIIFEDGTRADFNNKKLHPELVDALQHTASKIAGLSPAKKAKTAAPAMKGYNVGMNLVVNTYLSKTPVEQKQIRLALIKKMSKQEAEKGARTTVNLADYSAAQKDCIKALFGKKTPTTLGALKRALSYIPKDSDERRASVLSADRAAQKARKAAEKAEEEARLAAATHEVLL